MSSRIFTEDDIQRMVHLYTEVGLSSSEIGQMMYCHPGCVRRQLRNAGVEIRPKGGSKPLRGISHQEMELIRYLYCFKEWTTPMIGAYLGLHDTSVRNRLQQAGIPRRSRSECLRVAYKHGRAPSQRSKGRQNEQLYATAA